MYITVARSGVMQGSDKVLCYLGLSLALMALCDVRRCATTVSGRRQRRVMYLKQPCAS